MRNLNEVREALLNSTVRIVAQYGLERTTTKLIAADTQINEAYIYRCYDSKDSLLQATFHMEDVCLAEHVRKSLPVMRILAQDADRRAPPALEYLGWRYELCRAETRAAVFL